MGAGTRDALLRDPLLLPAADREPVLDLAVAALRVDVPLLALRFELPAPPRADDADRLADVLRELDPAADADFPRVFVLFDLFFPLDALVLLDLPRDFFALVAIDASPRSHLTEKPLRR
jgi:hypothetical protein